MHTECWVLPQYSHTKRSQNESCCYSSHFDAAHANITIYSIRNYTVLGAKFCQCWQTIAQSWSLKQQQSWRPVETNVICLRRKVCIMHVREDVKSKIMPCSDTWWTKFLECVKGFAKFDVEMSKFARKVADKIGIPLDTRSTSLHCVYRLQYCTTSSFTRLIQWQKWNIKSWRYLA